MRRPTYIPEPLRESLQQHIRRAVANAVDAHESGQEDEDTLTGQLGYALRIRRPRRVDDTLQGREVGSGVAKREALGETAGSSTPPRKSMWFWCGAPGSLGLSALDLLAVLQDPEHFGVAGSDHTRRTRNGRPAGYSRRV